MGHSSKILFSLPPLSNRGVEKHKIKKVELFMNNQKMINGLYARCDWLEFTITELNFELSSYRNVEYYLHMLGLSVDLFDILDRGGFGYKSQMRHMYENIFVFYDGNDDMGIHVRISGTAVTYVLKMFLEYHSCDTPFGKGYFVGDYDTNNIFPMFLKRVFDFGHFTRIDLALDDVGAEYFSVQDVLEILESGSCVCKFKKWENIKGNSFSGNCNGHTIYMGSRQSDVYLRVYEKALEQGFDEIKWTRWELEIKHEKADVVAQQLIDNFDFGYVTMGILNQYVRFVNIDNNRRSLCSVNPIWEKFTENVEKLRLYVPERNKSIDDKRIWIERQCMPTIAGLFKANGGKAFFDDDDLKKHYDRLKEKDRRLFEGVAS